MALGSRGREFLNLGDARGAVGGEHTFAKSGLSNVDVWFGAQGLEPMTGGDQMSAAPCFERGICKSWAIGVSLLDTWAPHSPL